MIAILSDIHSNLEALQAVLEDVREQGVDRIYCLGDIVGYGPNPRECIDLVMGFPVVLLGNHDQAAIFDPEGFNTGALRAILWTRRQLEEDPNRQRAMQRWEFLGELPRKHIENGIIYVHGSVRNPLNEYVFPEDVYNQRKMEKIFALVERYCFQGHTHVPGIFTERLEYYHPEEINNEYRLDNSKALINVGSVGQPRDNDWRACYVLFDEKERLVRFRRVPYDVEETIRKIHEIEELDDYLGDRLREGK